MKCDECKIDYPAAILAPMTTSAGNLGQVCGICALEISNRVLGFKRTQFTGNIAETYRIAAIKWRKEHPPKADS